MNEKIIASAVLYVKKQLDNHTLFECAVLLSPIFPEHRMSYSFTLTLNGESVTVTPERCDFDTAEKIFNGIVCRNLAPMELEGFVNMIIL